jgi:hypothetical protein
VSTVDEGMEVLSGIPAGERIDGRYAEGTVNFLVQRRLKLFAEAMKRFGPDGRSEQ